MLLGLSEKELARQYLAAMAKENLDGEDSLLMKVYAAWLDSLDGKTDAAIKSLEGMLDEHAVDASTAEAADVLAMLHIGRGERDKAQKTVDFGLGFLKYRELKTPYIETLLRGRMGSNITAADDEKQYAAAEKLRQQDKIMDAGRAFAKLREQSPKSIWADAAGFRIGQCLLGLNRGPEALAHWKSFVAQSPDGPWRGQARVALVDLMLETNLDIAGAAEQAAAATATLARGPARGLSPFAESAQQKGTVPLAPRVRDPAPDTSWQSAALEIHLRQGTVSLIQSHFDAAALAFQQAKDALPKAPTDQREPQGASRGLPLARPVAPGALLSAGVDRLLDAAANKSPLLPPDAALRGNSQTQTALALGQIDLLLDRPSPAAELFMAALREPRVKKIAAERSFAALGLARAYIAQSRGPSPFAQSAQQKGTVSLGAPGAGKPPGTYIEFAKLLYQRSLKERSDPAWHDQTLRELALLIERIAIDRFPPLADPSLSLDGNKTIGARGEGRGRSPPRPTPSGSSKPGRWPPRGPKRCPRGSIW